MNTLQIAASGQTHVGNSRPENQDSFRVHASVHEHALDSLGYLFAVADGMGGYEHGGIASVQALETFFDAFYRGHPSRPAQNLRGAAQAANLAVYQTAQRLGARMGTTLSAINLAGRQLNLAHIGDSRVYMVRGRKATCLTNDHTAVGELVRMRILSPDKVRTHDRRSVLEKCLGMQLFIQPDITQHTLVEDDYLILCTDGVWSHVEDDEFAQVALSVREPEQISQTLINIAMERDSDDNLSAVAIHIEHLATETVAPSEKRSWALPHLLRGKLTGKA
jgi:protein phosphatase